MLQMRALQDAILFYAFRPHFAILNNASCVPYTLSVFPNPSQKSESNDGMSSIGFRCIV